MKEEAKAAKEIAKTAGKAVDGTRELGKFVGRYVDGRLKQISGIVEDKLSYVRWERTQRLRARADAYLAEKGLDAPTRLLPLKVGVPLIEAASLEEDDDLQDYWARLLANAADAESGVEVQRRFVSILQDFNPLEAQVLSKIASEPEEVRRKVIHTAELPDRAIPHEEEGGRDEAPGAPSADVELALWNLVRLGCVASSATYGGGATVYSVRITELGIAIVEACTIRPR